MVGWPTLSPPVQTLLKHLLECWSDLVRCVRDFRIPASTNRLEGGCGCFKPRVCLTLLPIANQVASFAARGFLRFDALVPDELDHRIQDAFNTNLVAQLDAVLPLSKVYAPHRWTT